MSPAAPRRRSVQLNIILSLSQTRIETGIEQKWNAIKIKS